MLAGWFSLKPVSKKFNPRSIFLIPTPPCFSRTTGTIPYLFLPHHLHSKCYQFRMPERQLLVFWRSPIHLPRFARMIMIGTIPYSFLPHHLHSKCYPFRLPERQLLVFWRSPIHLPRF